MTAVQACRESGPVWKNLLDCRANLWAASDQFRTAEIPPFTVAAILPSGLTLRCINRHINGVVGLGSLTLTLAVKRFTSGVARKWALATTAVTMPKNGIAAGTLEKIGIGTREGLQRLRLEVSKSGFPHRVRDEFFST
jgi:hypothetical protein